MFFLNIVLNTGRGNSARRLKTNSLKREACFSTISSSHDEYNEKKDSKVHVSFEFVILPSFSISMIHLEKYNCEGEDAADRSHDVRLLECKISS